MTKIAMTSHCLSPLSGDPGTLERVGLLEGDASPEEVVVPYHERSKHHFHRYAASLGYMDCGDIFGHSLGGAIAIELASRVPGESGTLFEGTLTSIPDVFGTMKWGSLPLGPLITQRFGAIDRVANIGSPLLLVHGTEDSLIKPELGRRRYEAARVPKAFALVEGGSLHDTNAIGQAQYKQAITQLFGLK